MSCQRAPLIEYRRGAGHRGQAGSTSVPLCSTLPLFMITMQTGSQRRFPLPCREAEGAVALDRDHLLLATTAAATQ
jgi:hypothetical protein